MPIYQHKKDTHLLNPQSANWINTLPPLEGKTILKFGSQKTIHLQMLLAAGCHRVICVGEINESLKSGTLSYVSELQSVESEINVCIIDEPEFFDQFRVETSLNQILQKINKLLSDDGIILIGFPRRIKFYRTRRQVLRLIKRLFPAKVDIYVCQPSFYFPMFIYPFSQVPCVIRKMFIRELFKSLKPKKVLKDILKYLLYHSTILANPLLGLYYVARKDDTNYSVSWAGEAPHKKAKLNQKTFTIWMSKPWGQKQIGLNYCIEREDDFRLHSITKQSTPILHRTEALKQEYINLQILKNFERELLTQKIEVPAPSAYSDNSYRITFIQKSLGGDSLHSNWLGPSISPHKLRAKISGRTDLVSNLVDLQVKMQKILNKLPSNRISNIADKYYYNSLKISESYLNNLERVKYYNTVIQQGDFSDVNILYNQRRDLWGIIDWEWMAAGYPPLFDLWTLFKSIAFQEKPDENLEMFEAAFQSLIDSFFRKNWFSNFLKKKILEYCKIFEIDPNRVYGYFLDYALISANKYLYDFNMPQFEQLFNRILIYALENPHDFLIVSENTASVLKIQSIKVEES